MIGIGGETVSGSVSASLKGMPYVLHYTAQFPAKFDNGNFDCVASWPGAGILFCNCVSKPYMATFPRTVYRTPARGAAASFQSPALPTTSPANAPGGGWANAVLLANAGIAGAG